MIESNTAEKNLVDFFRQYEKVRYEKKEILVSHYDQVVNSAYFLDRGYVSASIVSKYGEQMILDILKPGSLLPMIYPYDHVPNSLEFRALTFCSLFKAPIRDTFEYVKKSQDLQDFILKQYGFYFKNLVTLLGYLRFDHARERIFHLMNHLGEMYGQRKNGYYIIDIPFVNKDIAAYTGLSRETVSREISRLIKNKTIDRRKRKLRIKIEEGER